MCSLIPSRQTDRQTGKSEQVFTTDSQLPVSKPVYNSQFTVARQVGLTVSALRVLERARNAHFVQPEDNIQSLYSLNPLDSAAAQIVGISFALLARAQY